MPTSNKQRQTTTEENTTGQRLAPLQPVKASPPTESSSPQTGPSMLPTPLSILPTLAARTRRIVDFDVETVAAGYADPNWVPHIVTAWAYQWIEDGRTYCDALPVRHLHDVDARRRFLLPLLAVLESADIVTGHNLLRFDLPVLQAEVMRLGLESLPPLMVQDTIRLPRAKGFKKGQDNLGVLLDVPLEKKALNWQEWQTAYSEPDLATVKERCAGDVRQHVLIREQMRLRGWLSAPRRWQP